MKNKKTALFFVLIVITTVSAFAQFFGQAQQNRQVPAVKRVQKYDNASDFMVYRKDTEIMITGYLGSRTEIRIPPRIQNLPVTSIGYNAFSGCSNITSVIIPNSVTSIEFLAFSGCSSLTSITIPNSVTTIGEYAFSSCTRLKSVTIEDSVTIIGEHAFSFCTSLTSITISNNVTSIGDGAFEGCRSLVSVTFQGAISSSGFHSNAFSKFGDLRDKFYATDTANGTPGTYTTTAPVSERSTWTKQ